jgi:hypothetical protein
MASVFLHSPLNINLSLAEMVQRAAREIAAKHDTLIEVKSATCYQREDGLLPLTATQMEDMIITYGSDFATIGRAGARDVFCPCLGQFPLREELTSRGLADPEGYFHPIFLIPLIIIYNRQLITEKEVPQTWGDLLDARWHGRILFPERHLPASRAILALLQHLFPDRFQAFLANIVFKGSPVDVKNAVDEGQFPLGINKVSFARYARHKNVAMIWPAEGAFCLPNIMAWKQGADAALLDLGQYLRSVPVQDFFLRQGYIPVIDGLPMLPEAELNDCRLLWRGWDWFFDLARTGIAQ